MTTKRRLTLGRSGWGSSRFLAGLLFGYDQGAISGALPETKGCSLEETQERGVVGGDRMLDEETA